MADGFTFVDGVGDEVVLFGAFLFLAMCMLVYVSLRESRNERPREEHRQEERTDDTNDEEAVNNQPETTTASSNVHSVTSDETADATTDESRHQPDCHGSQVPNEESVLRSRSSQTQDARNTNANEETLSIRLILPNNSTLPVNAQPSTTLGDVRRTYFQEQLAGHRPVRFIYQGRVLDNDNQTLQDLDIGSNHVIHVHIGRPRPPGTEGGQNFGLHPPNDMLDISRWFFPLLGLILSICWVGMFCFPHVFSLLSKVLLFILSLGYVFMAYVSTQTAHAE